MECHEFDIEIKPDGEVKIHVKGAKGPLCLEYAKLFEKILGSSGTRELTGEYYEAPSGVQIHIENTV